MNSKRSTFPRALGALPLERPLSTRGPTAPPPWRPPPEPCHVATDPPGTELREAPRNWHSRPSKCVGRTDSQVPRISPVPSLCSERTCNPRITPARQNRQSNGWFDFNVCNTTADTARNRSASDRSASPCNVVPRRNRHDIWRGALFWVYWCVYRCNLLERLPWKSGRERCRIVDLQGRHRHSSLDIACA